MWYITTYRAVQCRINKWHLYICIAKLMQKRGRMAVPCVTPHLNFRKCRELRPVLAQRFWTGRSGPAPPKLDADGCPCTWAAVVVEHDMRKHQFRPAELTRCLRVWTPVINERMSIEVDNIIPAFFAHPRDLHWNCMYWNITTTIIAIGDINRRKWETEKRTNP
jgi:hypothetical protein